MKTVTSVEVMLSGMRVGGEGYAHSCNYDKDQYGDKLGIGQILRGDRSKRTNTHDAMSYLVKDDQHLCLKPAGTRCLRKGTLNCVRCR